VRFPVSQLRAASRQSGGVRGIRPTKGDKVVGMDIALPGGQLLVVSAFGFGKRTPVEEYPTHNGVGRVCVPSTPTTRRGRWWLPAWWSRFRS